MPVKRSAGGYIVLHEVSEGIWRVVGQADRRPGLTARAARARAVQDATGGKANRDDVYAAVPLSEWRIALEL
jgi:hypothetical protein